MTRRNCDATAKWTKENYLKLIWGKVTGAAGYEIYVRKCDGKSLWTKAAYTAKSVTAGIKAITLGVKKTTKLTSMVSKVNKKCKLVKHDTLVRYISSNPSVAKVDLNTGKVIGVKAGKCKIYCIALNGVKATVSVTVK